MISHFGYDFVILTLANTYLIDENLKLIYSISFPFYFKIRYNSLFRYFLNHLKQAQWQKIFDLLF